MDNFKRHKNTGRKRYVDGIINDFGSRAKSSGGNGFTTNQLDNFKKPEGFSAAGQRFIDFTSQFKRGRAGSQKTHNG